ncbi:putative ribonuclease H-like domain-containing protein [Tanacetum coccineum]
MADHNLKRIDHPRNESQRGWEKMRKEYNCFIHPILPLDDMLLYKERIRSPSLLFPVPLRGHKFLGIKKRVDSMVNWSDHEAENKTGEVEKVYGLMAGLHANNGFKEVLGKYEVFDFVYTSEFIPEPFERINLFTHRTKTCPLVRTVTSLQLREPMHPVIQAQDQDQRLPTCFLISRTLQEFTQLSVTDRMVDLILAASRNNHQSILWRTMRSLNDFGAGQGGIANLGGEARIIRKCTIRTSKLDFENVFTNEHNCVACNKGKQHKASYKHISAVRLITETLQLLHMDLFGPTNIRSIDQKYYSLVVTDDFSRFTWTFYLSTKDETFYVLKEFIALIENQLNKKVKGIRCDNGTEFKNAKLIELCGEKGIKRDYSNPRTPQQNGVAERKIGL